MLIDTNLSIVDDCVVMTQINCDCIPCQMHKLYLQCVNNTLIEHIATCKDDRCTYYYGKTLQCVHKKRGSYNFCRLHNRTRNQNN